MSYHYGKCHHHPCIYTYKRLTQPCLLNWTGNLRSRTETEEHVIALPGDIDKIQLRSTEKQGTVFFKWVGERNSDAFQYKTKATEKCSHHSPSPLRHKFPNYTDYNKHTQVKIASNSTVYHFVKYMDNTHDLNYIQKLERNSPGSVLKIDKEPSCPNYTHTPKLISWIDASQMCKEISGTLPEFFGREEQEQFIKILKYSSDLFPIEAIYIGLFQKKAYQVS